MKRLLLYFCAGAALAFALILPAAADGHESTVNATVSAKVIAVSASPTSLTYGQLVAGTIQAVPSPLPVTVTNEGNVTETFLIRGFDTAAWTLASIQGPDQYVHRFSTSGTGPFTPLTLADQQLFAGVPALNGIELFLNMDLPTSTSTGAQQTAAVMITATE